MKFFTRISLFLLFFPLFYQLPTMGLKDCTEEYYKSNKTILIPNESLKKTIITVQKLTDPLSITANIDELAKNIQLGAAYIYQISVSTEPQIKELAQKIAAHEVPYIIEYLYSQSCLIRPDKTGFSEGIIFIPASAKYYAGLKCFFEAYETRVKVGNATQKSSNIPLIETAQTAGAFRLMCIEVTETNQEKIAPFLGKFKNFYIIINKDGIRIKPERLPKVGIVNKFKVFIGRTPNASPHYNKPTDVPSDLINAFIYTFPNAKLKNGAIISDMYNYIVDELQIADSARKLDILKCKNNFELVAAKKGLSHLSTRTGSEIILGDEDLYWTLLSEKNNNKLAPEAYGIYLLFTTLRDHIRTYVTEGDTSTITELSLKNDIDIFYTIATSKTIDTLNDTQLQKYLYNTALTLKYLSTLEEESLPDTPTKSFRERLTAAIFETHYQSKLKISLIAETINSKNQNDKLKKLDDLLAKKFASFWNAEEKQFPKKYPFTLPVNTILGKLRVNQQDIFETDKKIYSKTIQPFTILTLGASDLQQFALTYGLFQDVTRQLVGTALVGTQSEWFKNQLATDLESFYANLKLTINGLVETIEANGFYCPAGKNGKDIISKTCSNLLKNEQDKKEPKAIEFFKKSIRVFPSVEALQVETKKILDQQKEFDINFK